MTRKARHACQREGKPTRRRQIAAWRAHVGQQVVIVPQTLSADDLRGLNILDMGERTVVEWGTLVKISKERLCIEVDFHPDSVFRGTFWRRPKRQGGALVYLHPAQVRIPTRRDLADRVAVKLQGIR